MSTISSLSVVAENIEQITCRSSRLLRTTRRVVHWFKVQRKRKRVLEVAVWIHLLKGQPVEFARSDAISIVNECDRMVREGNEFWRPHQDDEDRKLEEYYARLKP